MYDVFCALREDSKGEIEFVATDEGEKQTEWPHQWDKKIITYAVLQGTKDAGIFSKLRKAVGLSFSTWGKEIPVRFKRVKKSQNPDITIEFVDDSEQDPYLKKSKTVLAYAYYPKTSQEGVIRFNDYAYHWSSDGNPVPAWKIDPKRYPKTSKTKVRTFNVIHVLIHEIGHSIGLKHAEIKNGADIMDPIYNGKVILSDYDILRIRAKYGIRRFKNWNLYLRLSSILSRRKKGL